MGCPPSLWCSQCLRPCGWSMRDGINFFKFKNLALFHCAVKELQRLWMLCEWENEKLNFCCCIECAAGRGPVELVDGGWWDGVTNLSVFLDRAVKYLLNLKVEGEEEAGSQVLSYSSNTSPFAEVLQEREKMQVREALLASRTLCAHAHCASFNQSNRVYDYWYRRNPVLWPCWWATTALSRQYFFWWIGLAL